jgi:hypothetical protein
VTQREARLRVLELGTTSGALETLRGLRSLAKDTGDPRYRAEVAELEEVLRLADGIEFEAPVAEPEPRQVGLFVEPR